MPTYSALRDQTNALWYLTAEGLPDDSGAVLVIDAAVPPGENLTPAPEPSWLVIGAWYVYPTPGGELRIETVPPGTGIGAVWPDGLLLTDAGGAYWLIGVTPAGELSIGIGSAPPPEPEPVPQPEPAPYVPRRRAVLTGTRADLRRRLLILLDEDPDDPQFLTTDQANAVLDEAGEVLAEETQALKRRFLIARQPGSLLHNMHSLSDGMMSPYRLYVPSLRRRLEPVTYRELDNRSLRWWTEQGPPWVFASVSWDTMAIWPSAGAGGEVIEIDALVWPDPLMDDLDTPEWPDADHDGLILWGLYETLLKRWDIDRATIALSKFMQAYGMSRERTGARLIDEGVQARGRQGAETPWRMGRY